jgi:hypothetical protein
MATLICPKCAKNFDSDKLRVYKCPDCKKWLDWGPDVEVQKYEPAEVVRDELDDLDPATKALVRAANRTTYAVRSLAMYLFITIATGFCGGVLFLIGRPEAALIGAIVIIIGFVWAVAAGLNELSKSEP